MAKAVRVFDVEEHSIQGGGYEIVVSYNGNVVETIRQDTMMEAHRILESHGYELVCWTEGKKIVLY